MASLKAIRKRIAVTGSTQKLTKAMKMIASTMLRRATAKVMDARVYNGECVRILGDVISKAKKVDIALARPADTAQNAEDLVIFSSDKGLCGTFNEALFKKAIEHIKEKEAHDTKVNCHVIGKKGADFFKRSSRQAASINTGLSKKDVSKVFGDIVSGMRTSFLNGRSRGATLIYNEFKGVGGGRVVIKRLLPVSPPDVKPTFGVEHIYEPDLNGVLSGLVEEMVSSTFRLAYLESFASEVAARMLAMEKATQNAEELIHTLTIQYNKARQAAITTELVDIVAGVEALKG